MFKNPAQRAAYFEHLRQQGKFNPKGAMGMPPAQHNNLIASSPALPPVMPPKAVQPNMFHNSMPPNAMMPMNPAGTNRFNKLKRFF